MNLYQINKDLGLTILGLSRIELERLVLNSLVAIPKLLRVIRSLASLCFWVKIQSLQV